MTGVMWVLDAAFLSSGIQHQIEWPGKHTLISGQTGSGKSVALTLLLYRLAKKCPPAAPAVLYMLDYKAEDFNALMGNSRYFPYAAAEDGMLAYDRAFNARLDGTDSSRAPLILCCDEWGAFITGIEKKTADAHKKMLARWLMLGRSLGAIVILGMQRPDAAEYFTNSGIRDQFSVIMTLGTQSPEAISMLYSYNRADILPVRNVGEGYALFNGRFYHVQVPFIRNQGTLVDVIGNIV